MQAARCILLAGAVGLAVAGCNSATYVRTPAQPDALQKIAEGARERYTVEWVGPDRLELTDWWPGHSFLSLGYTRMRADLRYADGELDGDFYLASNQLFTLYLPVRFDAGIESTTIPLAFMNPALALAGGSMKPEMRSQIDEILSFVGTSLQRSEVTHDVSPSVAAGTPRTPRPAPATTPATDPDPPVPETNEATPSAERIEQLLDQLERGEISPEEFEAEKNRILRGR